MRRFALLAILVSVVLAVVVSPWASSKPDGLEKVAERHGFSERARVHDDALLPEYTPIAGLVGTLATLAIGTGVAIVIVRRREA
ncbi:MAG: PDGLE domain-containing protein [Solirubrobacteraceae bacterium]|nr:PDGLE domain-containing protein [Solirubrobacteraceae bacterium]